MGLTVANSFSHGWDAFIRDLHESQAFQSEFLVFFGQPVSSLFLGSFDPGKFLLALNYVNIKGRRSQLFLWLSLNIPNLPHENVDFFP